MDYILDLAKRAKKASKELNKLDTRVKNEILRKICDSLDKNREIIKRENEKDLVNGREKGLTNAFLDRLTLTDTRIDGMIQALEEIANFSDPIGEIVEGFRHENNMEIKKVRVPLGVIGMIYESRPNVTVDAGALCFKSGNAIILRGGSDAINSNKILADLIREILAEYNIVDAVQLVENLDRQVVNDLVTLTEYVDVIIPRGGRGLKKAIMANATVPVIETGAGLCHTYIDEFANLSKAVEIAVNAKTHRPGVCNSMETLLVHKSIAKEFLPIVYKRLNEKNVEVRVCKESIKYIPEALLATEEDWDTEYLELTLSIKVVGGVEEAIEHINKHSTKHSEAIITENIENSKLFTRDVDSACVYVNASTRFTDGGEFGFGGEIGISTQKLHVRGPMGLRALTSEKYIIEGNGQIR